MAKKATAKKAASKPAAGRSAPSSPPKRAADGTTRARIRMYRLGVGDCFLDSLPATGKPGRPADPG